MAYGQNAHSCDPLSWTTPEHLSEINLSSRSMKFLDQCHKNYDMHQYINSNTTIILDVWLQTFVSFL